MSEYILQLSTDYHFNFASCVQLGEFSTLEEAFNYLLKHLNDVEIKEDYLNHFECFEIIKIRKENKNKIVAVGELKECNDNLCLKIYEMSE